MINNYWNYEEFDNIDTMRIFKMVDIGDNFPVKDSMLYAGTTLFREMKKFNKEKENNQND